MNKKNIKPIYLLDPKLKWKTFKALQIKDSGPVPVGLDRILWKMNRKKIIYCWFDPDHFHRGMIMGQELPKNREIKVITNN